MSYFATSSAYSYADHPFSYSVRRQSALSRVLDVVLPARRNTDRSPSSLLHDQALTAQPPVLKRSGTKTRVISSETVWAVTEEVVVSVAIAVAAGFLTKLAASAVYKFLSTSNKAITPETKDENESSS